MEKNFKNDVDLEWGKKFGRGLKQAEIVQSGIERTPEGNL